MITQKYNYTPLNRETIDGKRHYCLPDGSKVSTKALILSTKTNATDVVAGKVLEFNTL
jgi:hypothetical protein